jgi:hypothetical protein
MELARAVVIDPEGEPTYHRWEPEAEAQARLRGLEAMFGTDYDYRLETR